MPDAVSTRVAAAVKNVIDALTLNPAPTAVAVRRRLTLGDGESPPLVLVAQGDGWQYEALASGATPGKVLWLVRYPVGVAAAFKSQGKAGQATPPRDWWDVIWPAVADWRTGLAVNGLPEVNGVSPSGRAVFDLSGQEKLLDWGVTAFTVETLEER